VSAFANTAFRLPPRYEQQWGTEFWSYVDAALRSGAVILDVGAGRQPTIAPERRPPQSHYVGLDISGEELERAAPASYDEKVVADAQKPIPSLSGRFDLIVAWQVLEHFTDLPRASDSFRMLVKPGGWFVACLSGRRAAFSIVNRILPSPLAERLVAALMRRPVETVFPAHYDHCDERGLRRAFSDWDELHVVPLWRGADYFARLPGLRRLYVRYENFVMNRGFENLATHYVVAARKQGAERDEPR
jgi:SAM-dependent methyltransferase